MAGENNNITENGEGSSVLEVVMTQNSSGSGDSGEINTRGGIDMSGGIFNNIVVKVRLAGDMVSLRYVRCRIGRYIDSSTLQDILLETDADIRFYPAQNIGGYDAQTGIMTLTGESSSSIVNRIDYSSIYYIIFVINKFGTEHLCNKCFKVRGDKILGIENITANDVYPITDSISWLYYGEASSSDPPINY